MLILLDISAGFLNLWAHGRILTGKV